MKQAAVIPAVWEQYFELGACGTEIVRKGDDKTKRKYERRVPYRQNEERIPYRQSQRRGV